MAFDEIYAEWLPQNLHHVNRGSMDILEALKTDDFEHVRYSTVVSVNNEKERNTFNRLMRVVL